MAVSLLHHPKLSDVLQRLKKQADELDAQRQQLSLALSGGGQGPSSSAGLLYHGQPSTLVVPNVSPSALARHDIIQRSCQSQAQTHILAIQRWLYELKRSPNTDCGSHLVFVEALHRGIEKYVGRRQQQHRVRSASGSNTSESGSPSAESSAELESRLYKLGDEEDFGELELTEEHLSGRQHPAGKPVLSLQNPKGTVYVRPNDSGRRRSRSRSRSSRSGSRRGSEVDPDMDIDIPDDKLNRLPSMKPAVSTDPRTPAQLQWVRYSDDSSVWEEDLNSARSTSSQHPASRSRSRSRSRSGSGSGSNPSSTRRLQLLPTASATGMSLVGVDEAGEEDYGDIEIPQHRLQTLPSIPSISSAAPTTGARYRKRKHKWVTQAGEDGIWPDDEDDPDQDPNSEEEDAYADSELDASASDDAYDSEDYDSDYESESGPPSTRRSGPPLVPSLGVLPDPGSNLGSSSRTGGGRVRDRDAGPPGTGLSLLEIDSDDEDQMQTMDLPSVPHRSPMIAAGAAHPQHVEFVNGRWVAKAGEEEDEPDWGDEDDESTPALPPALDGEADLDADLADLELPDGAAERMKLVHARQPEPKAGQGTITATVPSNVQFVGGRWVSTADAADDTEWPDDFGDDDDAGVAVASPVPAAASVAAAAVEADVDAEAAGEENELADIELPAEAQARLSNKAINTTVPGSVRFVGGRWVNEGQAEEEDEEAEWPDDFDAEPSAEPEPELAQGSNDGAASAVAQSTSLPQGGEAEDEAEDDGFGDVDLPEDPEPAEPAEAVETMPARGSSRKVTFVSEEEGAGAAPKHGETQHDAAAGAESAGLAIRIESATKEPVPEAKAEADAGSGHAAPESKADVRLKQRAQVQKYKTWNPKMGGSAPAAQWVPLEQQQSAHGAAADDLSSDSDDAEDWDAEDDEAQAQSQSQSQAGSRRPSENFLLKPPHHTRKPTPVDIEDQIDLDEDELAAFALGAPKPDADNATDDDDTFAALNAIPDLPDDGRFAHLSPFSPPPALPGAAPQQPQSLPTQAQERPRLSLHRSRGSGSSVSSVVSTPRSESGSGSGLAALNSLQGPRHVHTASISSTGSAGPSSAELNEFVLSEETRADWLRLQQTHQSMFADVIAPSKLSMSLVQDPLTQQLRLDFMCHLARLYAAHCRKMGRRKSKPKPGQSRSSARKPGKSSLKA